MTPDIDIRAGSPSEFSQAERTHFVEFVCAGGEIDGVAIQANVEVAAGLVFLTQAGRIVGAGALKIPQLGYRDGFVAKAGVALPVEIYPYELGYILLHEDMRGRGLARKLMEGALQFAGKEGVFATVRTDNGAMRACLSKYDFDMAGEPYPGMQDRRIIQLYVRKPRD